MEHTRDRIYVDGAWVPSTGTGTLPVTNPFTEQVVGTVPEGTVEDVDRAARAASRALSGWSATSLDDRVKACTAIAEGLKARAQEVALAASTEMGAPWQIAVLVQAGLPVMSFASMEDVVGEVEWERRSGNSLLVASRSASSAPSRRGTTRCTRSRRRSRRRSSPAARSC
jgi:acyl-CoA reductase-like NAD-dependent aldehyde dehydrogenase